MTSNRVKQISSHLSPQAQSAAQPAEVPGPWKKAHPKWGNSMIVGTHFFEGKLPELFEKWREEYGNIFMWYNFSLMSSTHLGTEYTLQKQLVVADMKEMNRILKENPPKPVEYSFLKLLGEGVLSQYDPVEWERQRELIKPVFSVGALKRIVPVMNSGAKEMIEFIGEKADKGEAFDFHDFMSDLAFLMIGHSALGEESTFLKENAGDLRHAFEVILSKGFRGEDVEGDEEFTVANDVLKKFAAEVFARHEGKQVTQAAPSKCPFHSQAAEMPAGHPAPHAHAPPQQQPGNEKQLPSAIEVILGKDKDGRPFFSEQQKVDQLSTFMFAGHETTANTLSWAILELSRNPSVQEKLRKDVFETMAKIKKEKGEDYQLGFPDLFRFQYLTLVVNETLRLWPVVALGTIRELKEETLVGGYLIPKGTMVRFPHFLIHRDPAHWDNPDKFIPERKWNNDAFMPFTRAPRDCLGRNLAMLEIRTFLIALVTHFHFELEDPSQVITGFEAGTLRPANGAWVKVKRVQG